MESLLKIFWGPCRKNWFTSYRINWFQMPCVRLDHAKEPHSYGSLAVVRMKCRPSFRATRTLRMGRFSYSSWRLQPRRGLSSIVSLIFQLAWKIREFRTLSCKKSCWLIYIDCYCVCLIVRIVRGGALLGRWPHVTWVALSWLGYYMIVDYWLRMESAHY